MYTVSAEYKKLANAAARNVKVKVNVKEKILTDSAYTWQLRNTYYSTDKVVGLKIIEGQTTGAFRLGDTICPVLELKLSSDSVVHNNDLIEVLVSFDSGTEWQLLTSDFFVDSIDRQRQVVSVRALGTMIIVAKSYNSKLTFPTTTENVLSEMLDINAIGAGYTLLSNATISEKPVKGEAEDGSTLYYTRREMYGFLAAANGGSAYINNRNQLCFSTPRETGETFTHEQVLSETIGSERVISSIQWNTLGLSYSLGDDYNEDAIEFFNPLVFSGNEQILHGLEETLIGLDFSGAIIKKNGCGYFELGDIVTYTDINDNAHRLLIMGIVYDFSDGYFSETLYSLTNSKNQRQYAGQEVVSNQIGGGQAKPTTPSYSSGVLTSYEYLSDLSATANGITYTAELDESGLISKITDSIGGVIEPVVSGEITDISFHNAIAMAVAMAKGLASAPAGDLMPYTSGIYGYFDYLSGTVAPSLWRNSMGGDGLALYGATDTGEAVSFAGQSGSYGEFTTKGDTDLTLYAIARCGEISTYNSYTPAVMISNLSTSGKYGEISIQPHRSRGGIYCTCVGAYGAEYTNAGYDPREYHLVTVRRSGTTLTVWVDDYKAGNVLQANSLGSKLVLGAYLRGGSYAWILPTQTKFVAIGNTAQTDDEVAANIKYLVKRFGIAI